MLSAPGLLAAVTGLLLLVGCAEDTPMRGQFGNVKLVHEMTESGTGTAIVAGFLFTADGVAPVESTVVFGAANDVATDFEDFRVDLVDERGRVLKEYGIKDPRKVIVERHGWLERPHAYYAARFPLVREAVAVRVLNPRGKQLARADVAPVIGAFCREHARAKNCG